LIRFGNRVEGQMDENTKDNTNERLVELTDQDLNQVAGGGVSQVVVGTDTSPKIKFEDVTVERFLASEKKNPGGDSGD